MPPNKVSLFLGSMYILTVHTLGRFFIIDSLSTLVSSVSGSSTGFLAICHFENISLVDPFGDW